MLTALIVSIALTQAAPKAEHHHKQPAADAANKQFAAEHLKHAIPPKLPHKSVTKLGGHK